MSAAAATACRLGEDVTAGAVGTSGSPSLPDLRSVITNRNDATQAGSNAGMRGREIMIRGNDGFTVQQLGVPAVSTKLLVARAKLWSHGPNNYEDQVLLIYSMSEVTFAAEPFFTRGVSQGSLVFTAPWPRTPAAS